MIVPGGLGTLDEMFEALVLMQTRKIRHFPVVLLDRAFWEGMLGWVEERLLGTGLISTEDWQLIRLADTPEEAVSMILEETAKNNEV